MILVTRLEGCHWALRCTLLLVDTVAFGSLSETLCFTRHAQRFIPRWFLSCLRFLSVEHVARKCARSMPTLTAVCAAYWTDPRVRHTLHVRKCRTFSLSVSALFLLGILLFLSLFVCCFPRHLRMSRPSEFTWTDVCVIDEIQSGCARRD